MKFSLILLLFLPVGLLLVTHHWGIAIRITNWIFYLLAIIVVVKVIYAKKD